MLHQCNDEVKPILHFLFFISSTSLQQQHPTRAGFRPSLCSPPQSRCCSNTPHFLYFGFPPRFPFRKSLLFTLAHVRTRTSLDCFPYLRLLFVVCFRLYFHYFNKNQVSQRRKNVYNSLNRCVKIEQISIFVPWSVRRARNGRASIKKHWCWVLSRN